MNFSTVFGFDLVQFIYNFKFDTLYRFQNFIFIFVLQCQEPCLLGWGNIIYQGLIIYVFLSQFKYGEFIKGNSISILCSCVLFRFVYQKLSFTKKIYSCVFCVRDFVIIVCLYLASQTVSYFPFSRSTHQRYNTNSKSSWNFELFTEYFKYFDYSCNHISFGFFVLSMNFMQSQVTYEIAVYTYSLVILNNSQNLKKITVNAFLLQKFTVITKFYSAKGNTQTAP